MDMSRLASAVRGAFGAAALSAGVLIALPALAEMQTKTSSKSVPDTVDALETAVKAAGASIIARVDHSGAAEGAGMDMVESQLLIFGNPNMGTPPMQADPRVGLRLPLRVLTYADPDGTTRVVWEDTASLFEGLDVPDDAAYRAKIDGALEKLTDAAVSP